MNTQIILSLFSLTVPMMFDLFEAKKSEDEPHRPNQDYYVGLANDISFGAFIYPENEEEVLDAMERIFET